MISISYLGENQSVVGAQKEETVLHSKELWLEIWM
jgi:hypothetical protein